MMSFYVDVKGLMLKCLPRPRHRDSLDVDRAERLDQIPIIKVSGYDGEYYEKSEFNRLHTMV